MFPKKEVIRGNGEAIEAESPKEAFNKFIDQHIDPETVTGLRVKDSHTFLEDEMFEKTIYYVEEITIKD